MAYIEYAGPAEQKESLLPILALLLGLSGGPVAFLIGGTAGNLVPRGSREAYENLGFLGWLGFSFAVGTVALVRARTRGGRFRSLWGILLSCLWAALFLLLNEFFHRSL